MDAIEVAQRDSHTTAGSTERCPDCGSYTFSEVSAGEATHFHCEVCGASWCLESGRLVRTSGEAGASG